MVAPVVVELSVIEQQGWHQSGQARITFPRDLLLTQKMENNASGQPLYLGWARPGSAVGDEAWLIKKFTYDASGFITDIQFAGGTNAFDKSWNSRGSYTYS